MREPELREKIRIILGKTHGGSQRDFRFDFPVELLDDPDFLATQPASIVCEPLDLLRLLYNQCDPALKPRFLPILLGYCEGRDVVYSWVILQAVFALYGFEALREFLLKPDLKSIAAWHVVNVRLTMDSGLFSDHDLKWLDLRCKKARQKDSEEKRANPSTTPELDRRLRHVSVPFYAEIISKRVATIRYMRLRKELFESQNPEINSDKEILLSRFINLSFRSDIVSALQLLDSKIFQAGQPIEFKGCIDLLRTIYEEVVEDAAKTVAIKKQKQVPEYTSPFHPWNLYLQNEQILTTQEAELTQKLYNYLSLAGTHRLGSEPEQVRVCRNMVIELCLLIAGRVETIN